MTVSLPQEKLNKLCPLYTTLNDLFGKWLIYIREVVNGLIVCSFQAIKLARLHYRHLEFSKFNALKETLNDFDAACSLSQEAKDELNGFQLGVICAMAHQY